MCDPSPHQSGLLADQVLTRLVCQAALTRGCCVSACVPLKALDLHTNASTDFLSKSPLAHRLLARLKKLVL